MQFAHFFNKDCLYMSTFWGAGLWGLSYGCSYKCFKICSYNRLVDCCIWYVFCHRAIYNWTTSYNHLQGDRESSSLARSAWYFIILYLQFYTSWVIDGPAAILPETQRCQNEKHKLQLGFPCLLPTQYPTTIGQLMAKGFLSSRHYFSTHFERTHTWKLAVCWCPELMWPRPIQDLLHLYNWFLRRFAGIS